MLSSYIAMGIENVPIFIKAENSESKGGNFIKNNNNVKLKDNSQNSIYPNSKLNMIIYLFLSSK